MSEARIGEPTPPPAGFAACRTYASKVQISHLVVHTERGFVGPTLCGLTRFDERDEGRNLVRKADLPGWSMNGGTSGPGVVQVDCPACWKQAQ